MSFDKNVEKWAYVMQAELYSKLSQSKRIRLQKGDFSAEVSSESG